MLICLLATGCKPRTQAPITPEGTYQAIERTFLSGGLLRAQRDAESAAHRYAISDPSWSAQFRVESAKILLFQGRSAEAAALLEPPLAQGAPVEAIVRQNLFLGLAREYLGQQRLSGQALARAEALHPQGALQAEMIGVQGNIALNQGDLVAAERLLQSALQAARGGDTAFLQARMWNNLGVVALQQSHYEDALARFNHAASLAQTIGARPLLVKSFLNLGWIYYATGDFGRALESMQSAAGQAEAMGAGLDETQALINTGVIQFRLGDSPAALASYQRALNLAESLHNPEKLGSIHAGLAYLLLQTDFKSAEDHIREAARIAELRKNSVEVLEASLLEALLLADEGKASEAEGKLVTVSRQSADSPWLCWKAENTLAGLYAGADQRKKAEVWFERAIETFHRQNNSVSSLQMQLPFFENGSDLYLTYMEYLIRQHRSGDALRVLDRSRAEILAQGLHQVAKGDNPRSRQTSERVLASRLHGTILVYCVRPGRSYLWAINAKREEFHELPGSETILPLVRRHMQAILASKDLLAQKDSPAVALYDALVRPAAALLAPGGDRIYLIADRGLSGLNFETLVAPGERPHYWIEDATITNARSLRLLSAMDSHDDPRSRLAGQGRMLLIGNPVYRPEEYAPLPNAGAEMMGIASHFAPPQRFVLAGAAASPATYGASDARRFTYVHFVAHATADATNPLDSAIILSESAGGLSSYKLYAAEILKQPLDAELVTISSCYGSGVRNYSGEGVVGLVWAFLRAGAHAVIGALWEVSDVSTPQLMDSMYTELLRGSTPEAALRSAKLVMVHDSGVFRKPLYWAPFQIYSGR